MLEMDRRALLGAAAVGGVAAAVLAASSAEAAGQSGYFVIAEIVSKKDKADELRALMVPFAEIAAKEPGCLTYTLLEVIGEPGRILTFERWKDKAALDAHMVTPGDRRRSCRSWSRFWQSPSRNFSWMRAPALKPGWDSKISTGRRCKAAARCCVQFRARSEPRGGNHAWSVLCGSSVDSGGRNRSGARRRSLCDRERRREKSRSP